jgi:hypothetical protein
MLATLLALAGLAWGADKSPLVLDASNRPTPILAGDQIRLPIAGPFYTTLAPAAGASYTATFPAVTGTLAALNLAQTFTAQQQVQAAGALIHRQAATQDGVGLLGRAGGTSSYTASITPTTLTASRTFTLPDADVVAAGSASAGTSGRVVYYTTGGLQTGDALLTYNGTGGLALGDYTAGASLNLQAIDATACGINFKTSTNSALRWQLLKQGSAASHNFVIAAYDASGALIDIPLTFANASAGALTIAAGRPLFFGTSLTLNNAGSAPGTSGNGYSSIIRSDGTGSAPFNQAGPLVYSARVSSTAGRSSHLFYTGDPSTLRTTIDETGLLTHAGGITQTGGSAVSLSGDTTIASGKRLGIGALSSAAHLGITGGTSTLATTSQYNMAADQASNSTATVRTVAYYANPATAAASYTTADMVSFHSGQAFTQGAGSTITRTATLQSRTQTAGATSNMGWYHGTTSSLAGSGTWCLYNDSTDPSYLGSGRAQLGSATSAQALVFTTLITPTLQINAASTAGSTAAIGQWVADTGGPSWIFTKSRGGSVNTHTIVSPGDILGNLAWNGSDGSQFRTAARIYAYSSATPGASDMPGTIVLATTADGAASATDRMAINHNGTVFIGGSTSYINTSEVMQIIGSTATTNAVTPGLVWGANSTGTAAAGFGVSELVTLESSTTDNQSAYQRQVSWVTATHASRAARATFSIYDTAAREAFRLDTDGSGAQVSFFGAGSYGGGRNVIFITSTGTVPSSNPTGGGILYVEAGALKYRGTSGTVTTLGPP